MQRIVIKPYDPQWKQEFAQLKKVLTDHLQDFIIAIEHVGSTAVDGLCAKPIVDLNIIIDSRDILPDVIKLLKDLGYFHQGDLGIVDREAFGREKQSVPYCKYKSIWLEHHLYVCPQYSRELKRQIAFRGFLRQNPEKAGEYARLKIRLAKKYGNSRDTYTQMKSDFIENILSKIKIQNIQNN